MKCFLRKVNDAPDDLIELDRFWRQEEVCVHCRWTASALSLRSLKALSMLDL